MSEKKELQKEMLIVTIGAKDHASSRVRAIQYIPLLSSKMNYKISWIPRIPPNSQSIFNKYFLFPIKKRYLTLKRTYYLIFKKWDIIFIQKLFLPNRVLKQLKKRNSLILFDFDDAIYLEQKGQKLNELKTIQMIKSASKTIISTEVLAPFCEKHNVTPNIITSSVDTERIKPTERTDNDILTIGWIGSYSTTKFIREIYEPLLAISKSFKIRFLMVGVKPGFKLEGLNIVTKKWSLEKESELINEMDIGIMPLPDTEYAKAKGGYKLFLYMAAGIPIVASPIGINNKIIQNRVNGFFANNKKEWVKNLSELIVNKKLREKMGHSGRNIIEEKYSLNVCFKKLASLLEQ